MLSGYRWWGLLLLVLLGGCGGGGSQLYLVSGPVATQDLHTFENLTPQTVALSREERRLVELVTEHRRRHGLPPIPVSRSLTYVAKTHLLDIDRNNPITQRCNLHSWSSTGPWSGCCYTRDHAQAQCMWDKPAQLTPYPGSGFEISHGSAASELGDFSTTAEIALEGWKQSSGHHAVILNRDVWSDMEWQAMGVAIYKGSACIWFGEEPDPLGTP